MKILSNNEFIRICEEYQNAVYYAKKLKEEIQNINIKIQAICSHIGITIQNDGSWYNIPNVKDNYDLVNRLNAVEYKLKECKNEKH